MLEFFGLLPSYLIFFSIFLIILPTFVSILLRFFLAQHLSFLALKTRRILSGNRQGQEPRIITNLEQRLQQGTINIEQINTTALIENIYSQEKFSFLGLNLRCEQIETLTRTLPNLLLGFGLLGTFLGITINLANLSQTISQVDVSDVQSLIAELNQPLQGMGIAFVTSLIAVAASSLLTIINFTWNTNLAKSSVINSLEDYVDNIYLPQLPTYHPVKEGIDNLVGEFRIFINNLEQAITESLASPVEVMVAENKRVANLAEEVYSSLRDSSASIEQSAGDLRKAANTIQQSRFAEKLSSAIEDLAISQNQFSQSSLVLKKSTQSIENTLQTMQASMQKMLEVGEQISFINQKFMLKIRDNNE